MSDLPSEIRVGERKFKLRELDPGDMLALIEAAGAASDSSAWLRYAQMVCSVSDIDGVPQPMPRKKEMVKALAKKVGNDGMLALTAVFYPTPAETTEADAAPSENVAKN